ncbi:hypothetical protein VTO42DRAFT_8127 [Malbranchea cinnamomea]
MHLSAYHTQSSASVTCGGLQNDPADLPNEKGHHQMSSRSRNKDLRVSGAKVGSYSCRPTLQWRLERRSSSLLARDTFLSTFLGSTCTTILPAMYGERPYSLHDPLPVKPHEKKKGVKACRRATYSQAFCLREPRSATLPAQYRSRVGRFSLVHQLSVDTLLRPTERQVDAEQAGCEGRRGLPRRRAVPSEKTTKTKILFGLNLPTPLLWFLPGEGCANLFLSEGVAKQLARWC